jgi:hypothetical protein
MRTRYRAVFIGERRIEVLENVRLRMPQRLRTDVVKLRHAARLPTSGARMLPAALIIGTQRGGTSSLFKYLATHLNAIRSLRKETEFFSREYFRGLGWYKANFPLRVRASLRRDRLLTFEATPDYLFHPHAPARAADIVPNAKIIVLLGNPVERAISHYLHMVALGFESLSLPDALEAEASRIAPDVEAMERDPLHYCHSFLHFSYVSRGLYSEQLARWFRYFARERFCIIKSEDFYADPKEIYLRTLEFLGLPEWIPNRFPNYTGTHPKLSADETKAATAQLRAVFEEDAARLVELLGPRFRWI